MKNNTNESYFVVSCYGYDKIIHNKKDLMQAIFNIAGTKEAKTVLDWSKKAKVGCEYENANFTVKVRNDYEVF